jgi:hypothetical protein
MSPARRLSDLTPSRQALVRLFQEIDYGEIRGLEIRDSDPLLGSPPVVLFDVKLDADEGNRQEADLPDFALRDEVRRLMARFDDLKNGTIERIEIRSGIPRRVIIERRITEAPPR